MYICIYTPKSRTNIQTKPTDVYTARPHPYYIQLKQETSVSSFIHPPTRPTPYKSTLYRLLWSKESCHRSQMLQLSPFVSFTVHNVTR